MYRNTAISPDIYCAAVYLCLPATSDKIAFGTPELFRKIDFETASSNFETNFGLQPENIVLFIERLV